MPEEGDYRLAWDFTSESAIEEKWVTTADSTWGEGYSTCALDLREDHSHRTFDQSCQAGDFIAKFSKTGEIWSPFG